MTFKKEVEEMESTVHYLFVNCWKCNKRFDLTCAERCYEHLSYLTYPPDSQDRSNAKWTLKCSHCGACICHKYRSKMKLICENLKKNPRVKKSGIRAVTTSVYKRFCSVTL